MNVEQAQRHVQATIYALGGVDRILGDLARGRAYDAENYGQQIGAIYYDDALLPDQEGHISLTFGENSELWFLRIANQWGRVVSRTEMTTNDLIKRLTNIKRIETPKERRATVEHLRSMGFDV